jgi:hypothetical protein
MRVQPAKIKLGNREWVVRPLTLLQVQEIEPILTESAQSINGHVGAAIAIVSIALRRDYPEEAGEVGSIEATASEVGVAMATVLRLGGFLQAEVGGDPKSGEGVAGASITIGAPA